MYYNAVDERGEIIVNGMSDRGEVYQFHGLSPSGDFVMLYSVTTELFESASLNDSLLKEPEKHLFEIVVLDDTESKSIVHIIRETLQASDYLIKHPEKRMSETISLVDSMSRRDVEKYIHETLTIIDSVRRSGDCVVSKIYSIAARLTKNSVVYSNTKNSKTGRQK